PRASGRGAASPPPPPRPSRGPARPSRRGSATGARRRGGPQLRGRTGPLRPRPHALARAVLPRRDLDRDQLLPAPVPPRRGPLPLRRPPVADPRRDGRGSATG